MNEIKFRVWDKIAKKMSPEFVLFGEFTLMGAVHDWQWEILKDGFKGIEVTRYDSLGRLNDLEVMRFTGLKDKNGKDIFECDIVQRGVILFDDGKFQGYYYESNGGIAEAWEDDLCHERNIEVLGNMYENPELMKSDF